MTPARNLALAALVSVAGGAVRAQVPECPPVEAGSDLAEEPLADGAAPSVLVILPKDERGEVSAEGLALGPAAQRVESRFSPLLCATVVRISGAPGSAPAALIVELPTGAAAVHDDTYATEAEPDASDAAPSAADPYRPQQWALDVLGIDAARSVTRGEDARVAVLDTRVNGEHADLRGVRILGDPRAAPGHHGTLIAGIIRAAERNGAGIAGVAPAAALLSIPVCETSPSGDACRLYALLAGLDAAWGERAQVVNLSIVGPANRALERAVRRLDTLGVAIVAASGNRSSSSPAYPAAYPWVIGVAATDRAGRRAPSGPVTDLTAPGVEIVSTAGSGGYAFASGSSLAAAHVSAALTLLTAASDGDVAAARLALFRSARRTGPRAPPALAPLCDGLALLGKLCR